MILVTKKMILSILIFIAVAVFAFLLMKMLKKEEAEFEKVYNEVLISDKCKVKGRFEE